MKTALIVVSIVMTLSLGINFLMLRAAIKFTDKHEKLKLQYRKAKAKIMDLREDNCELGRLLADAKAECEKWKCKAVEISINAQKESER